MPIYRGSWYSQLPPFGWFDKEDRPGSSALGVPDSQQGIALPSRATLGKWFNVTPPGGGIPYPFQQTDIGPAKWTGRGTDISAAAAHQMGYTPQTFPTDAAFKIEPRDEPRGLGSPAGMPVQAGDVPDNTDETQTATASGPPQGRKMPMSLMDMFQPTDAGGEPADIGKALQSRSNSLIGLGMGLMSPAWEGQSVTGNALRGYQTGSAQDTQQARFAQSMAHQKTQDARQAAMDAFHRSQASITDAQRAMTDVLGPKASPAEKSEFMKNYYASKTDPGGWILKDIIDPNDPDGERKITVQEHNRTGQIRPPQLPGQTGAAASDPFAAGAAPPVYGAGPGGFSDTPQAGASAPTAPAATAATRGITLPNGETVTPPPGLSKKGREAWQNHIATTSADMASGKMTEAQAKYSIYATGMEIAHQELKNSSELGTSTEGKGLGGLPWGVGAFFQSNKYQNYRNAKDAWLNAKLRAESGATINPDEFARDDRIYFPQPGEGPEQVAAKARLRENITQKMTKAAGPGYVPAPPQAQPTTPATPAATAAPVRVTSPGAARKLPSGTQIILPDGRLGTVP